MQKSSRRMIVGGNWKCNLTQAAALELVDALNGMEVGDVEVVVAPVVLHLAVVDNERVVAAVVKGSQHQRAVCRGCQNP